DANGWALNAKAKMNVPFGQSLTGIAKLPPGSSRDLRDPFTEKKSCWPKFIVLALILYVAYTVLNHLGYVHQWTHGRIGIEKRLTTAQSATPANAAKPAADAAAAAAPSAGQ
ncbi:MAG TPA: hypothetical protein PKK20_04815, partial [Verrucomicrobiota bacterium]|nr:hypothetical protein [Verrucomicrobiota bacterium]